MTFKPGMALTLGLMLLAGSAVAGDRGTAEEAKALLARAVDHYTAVGRDRAIADFNERTGAYVDRDLYVMCYGPGKRITAHGTNPALLGKDITQIRDSDGKPFPEMMYDQGLANGSAQVEYKWSNPSTKKIEAKSTFVAKVAGDEICAVGYYK